MLLRPPISTLFPYTTLFRSTQIHCLFPLHSAEARNHDCGRADSEPARSARPDFHGRSQRADGGELPDHAQSRSEEHTSELQSRQYLVCRLLLEKKKKTTNEI